MMLIDDRGASKTYKGIRGDAVLTRNCGNVDRVDKWMVAVVVEGKYKRLATRADFQKAYAMAEKEIG